MNKFTANAFPQQRVQGDVDLVQCVVAILTKLHHPAPTAWMNNPTVAEATDAAPKLQRFLINRHWRYVLGMHPECTTRERFCLLDVGDDKEYLQIFEDAVAPFIVKYEL